MRTLVLTEEEFQYMRYIFCKGDDSFGFDASTASDGIGEKLTSLIRKPKAKADVWDALHEIARSY